MQDLAITEFRIGSIIWRGTFIMFRNFATFTLVGALVLLPVFALDSLIFPSDASDTSEKNYLYWVFGPSIAITILLHAFYHVVVAAVAYGAFQDLRGQRATVTGCLATISRLIVPVFGVAIAVTLAELFGILLFVVPGLVAATVFWLAMPVAVIERPGIERSLGRSYRLTEGCRWKILATILMLTLAASGIDYAYEHVFYIIVYDAGIGGELVDSAYVVAGYLVEIVTTCWPAVIACVGYYDLRVIKEGIDIEEIAAVFD